MLDSYEVGQRLTKDDFADSWYFPWGKWEYAEVDDIGDDIVTLHYYGIDGEAEDIREFTRAEMEEMLGWDISADDVRFDSDDSANPDADGIKASCMFW